MDGSRFDHLTRRWATRRMAVSSLVAGGIAGLIGLDAEAKRKRKPKHDHADADAEKKKPGALLGEKKKKKKKKKCKGGTIKCGKVCVTASSDAQNCGGCGARCGSGQACVGGACSTTGPVACPSGQIRCSGGCVDPASNEAHCGGCSQQCQGDLTCLDGTCGCAGGDTQCGTSCVDTQSDDDHCGGCGAACGSGKRCQSGQCVTVMCDANQILCNGTCVTSVGDHPCCSQFDCGAVGSYNDIHCDMTQHQCRCDNTNHGICTRTSDRRGICGECCEGGIGSLNCHGETGCYGYSSCSCPAGESKCPGGDDRCRRELPNADGTYDDPTTCLDAGGNNCVDCTQGGTRPYVCCWGRSCVDASGLGPGYSNSIGQMCGGCTKCPPDKACCNDGPGTAPKCKTPVAGGACPNVGQG